MRASNLLNLILLSAIWGGSFLFMRVGAPVLGPVALIAFRVGLAALFLWVVALFVTRRLDLRQHWQHYLVLGLLNSALPFILLAYAAQTLSASLLSILNATAPIFGAIVTALWTRKALPLKSVCGLVLGILGVAILVGLDAQLLQKNAGFAALAALAAALLYGIASNYARYARPVQPFANAHGSMWGATVALLPVMLLFPPRSEPSTDVVMSVIALGVVCSGLAYLMYFRLIEQVGAASALTVTFLVPVFGVLWGALFLGESVGWHTLVGSVTVVSGTALVTGFSPRAVFQARAEALR